MARPQGDAVVDAPDWNSNNWHDDATQHIYPFISYFELLAMYSAGDDAGALNMIRREWGTMARRPGPGDDVGDDRRVDGAQPTFSASDVRPRLVSGAAPALTRLRARRPAGEPQASRPSRLAPRAD